MSAIFPAEIFFSAADDSVELAVTRAVARVPRTRIDPANSERASERASGRTERSPDD